MEVGYRSVMKKTWPAPCGGTTQVDVDMVWGVITVVVSELMISTTCIHLYSHKTSGIGCNYEKELIALNILLVKHKHVWPHNQHTIYDQVAQKVVVNGVQKERNSMMMMMALVRGSSVT